MNLKNTPLEISQQGAISQESAGTPGVRLFVAGCVVLALFSATHMIPMFLSLFSEPTVQSEIDAKRAMAAVTVDIGPFRSHWGMLNQLLSTSYSTLLFFVVALNLVALPSVTAHGRLESLAAVNVVFVGALLALSLIFQFPPPGVFALGAEFLFLGALVRARFA